MVSGNREIERVSSQYFKKMFSLAAPSRADLEDCLRSMEPRVIGEMNEKLQMYFSRVGIEEVVKQMSPLKSPRPDSLGAYFYRSH